MLTNMNATVLEVTPRDALDAIQSVLGVTDDELAQALDADRRTLRRWRAGAAYPQLMARQRLAALLALEQQLAETFTNTDAVRRWFHAPSRYLGGITPLEAVRAGRTDRVEAALGALDAGVFL